MLMRKHHFFVVFKLYAWVIFFDCYVCVYFKIVVIIMNIIIIIIGTIKGFIETMNKLRFSVPANTSYPKNDSTHCYPLTSWQLKKKGR